MRTFMFSVTFSERSSRASPGRTTDGLPSERRSLITGIFSTGRLAFEDEPKRERRRSYVRCPPFPGATTISAEFHARFVCSFSMKTGDDRFDIERTDRFA